MRSNWRGSISAAISGRWRSSACRPTGAAPSFPRAGRVAVSWPPASSCVGEIGPRPFPVRAARPDALRAGHAAQDAAFDGQNSARHDLPLDVAIAEALFVVAPFGVAVEELAHRRVPPVDDVHAGGRIHERRPADEDVALDGPAPAHLLAQAQVSEVGGGGIDQDRLQIAAGERHVLQALHLRHQRRHVFQARLADLVAQRDHLFDVVAARRRAGGRARGRRVRGQAGQHAREQPLLLGGDVGGRHALRLHDGRSGVGLTS